MSQNQSLSFKWPKQAPDGSLYLLPTMQGDPNVSKSWEQFVKGWDGTASGYTFEPFHLHRNKKWQLQCVLKFVAGGQQLTNTVLEVKAEKPKISEDS